MLLALIPAVLFQQSMTSDPPVLLRRKVDVAATRQFFMNMDVSMKMDLSGMQGAGESGAPNQDMKFSTSGALSEQLQPLGGGKAKATYHLGKLTMKGIPGMGSTPPAGMPDTYSIIVSDRNDMELKGGNMAALLGSMSLTRAFPYPENPVRYGDTWTSTTGSGILPGLGAALPAFKMTYTFLGDEMVQGVRCHHIGVATDFSFADLMKSMGSAIPDSVKNLEGGASLTGSYYMDAVDGDFRDMTFGGYMNFGASMPGQGSMKMTMHLSGQMNRLP